MPFAVFQASMSSLLLGSPYELRDPTALTSLEFESLSSISLVFPSPSLLSLAIGSGLPSPDTILRRNDPFNDWGAGRGCNKFVPVLGGDGTKIAPTGNIFDQPPGGMISIRGKLADHVGDHVLLSRKGMF